MSVLSEKFYVRPADTVAKELLGAFLVCKTRRGLMRAIITETEAYMGPRDKASHASRGKTTRNAPMFGPPGRWYVYFCYGCHFMLNIVTGPKNYPAAVLIRGVILKPEGNFNGPGKLTRFLHIDKQYNEKRANKETGLWIEKGAGKPNIKKGPRVGVQYAGAYWAGRHLRFYLDGLSQ